MGGEKQRKKGKLTEQTGKAPGGTRWEVNHVMGKRKKEEDQEKKFPGAKHFKSRDKLEGGGH